MNLSELLRSAVARAPDKPALLSGGTSVEDTATWSEVESEANRVARALAEMGIGSGDRVALGLPNIPQFVYAYFGILRAGAVAVPLNVMLTVPEVARILENSGARAAFTAGSFGATVTEASEGVDSLEKIFAAEKWDELPQPEEVEAVGGNDDLAVLAYTSGTTGSPKGAMLSHANLLANLEQQMSIPEDHVREDDVLYLSLPLFHIFGLNVPLGLLVKNAATGVLLAHFEPVPALRVIGEHKVTVLFGAPPVYVAWTSTPGADQYDLSSVRLAISGAAPLTPEVMRTFRSLFGFDIDEGYGLTEAAPTLTSNRMASKPRAGSVGKPLPGIDMRLVDETGRDVEIGDPGEILVKGPNVFQGYWHDDEATAQILEDGWLHTGDIAVKDDDGFLYLVDRKRDLVIVSGFNVFPSEVESALLENPKVKDAAVIGVPHEYRGETIKAYVVLSPDASTTEAELIEDVSSRLARFKCPEKIEIVDELPHLLTGKVLRRALRG